MKNDVLCAYVLPTSEDRFFTQAEKFVESYNKFPAGMDHDFLLVVKGSKPEVTGKVISIYDELCASPTKNSDILVNHLGNEGYDIGPFIKVSNIYKDYKYIVCMGTSITFTADNWLSKFYKVAKNLGDKMGILGATGSLQRGFSNNRPNPHIRTSFYMFKPDLINNMNWGEMNTKMDCYQFEHGDNSITRQALNKGLACLVVGKNGIAYPPESWCSCNGFRQQNQENVLVWDFHCQDYANASDVGKAMLNRQLQCIED